ncbi:MAPEG family protein [Herbaspirillum sp. alder98]|uniref:MAPEG family protein n=1 Tax=Herbaspirillum sp. alder98 TaxID=2913096 RepID=UPI001CD8F648|nr:MAPEG family protein [Herbaspirillum sp. alder98]MCA1324863.1 MAPEG family protein [Herbaspirillum sp. alder98]
MPIATWCILFAGLLPIFTVAVAKWGRRDFDNAEPRAWMNELTGLRRRADYAHRNHFEALPLFAAGVLVAQQFDAPQGAVDAAALAFIACRLAYTALYLGNQASARSAVWTLGLLCNIALFVITALYS